MVANFLKIIKGVRSMDTVHFFIFTIVHETLICGSINKVIGRSVT